MRALSFVVLGHWANLAQADTIIQGDQRKKLSDLPRDPRLCDHAPGARRADWKTDQFVIAGPRYEDRPRARYVCLGAGQLTQSGACRHSTLATYYRRKPQAAVPDFDSDYCEPCRPISASTVSEVGTTLQHPCRPGCHDLYGQMAEEVLTLSSRPAIRSRTTPMDIQTHLCFGHRGPRAHHATPSLTNASCRLPDSPSLHTAVTNPRPLDHHRRASRPGAVPRDGLEAHGARAR